ncbi:MAG: hypothetical protein KIS94_07585 [Chitinophagales bacterium]|nr:hypothetical protein [Chitinophagales bacterium]
MKHLICIVFGIGVMLAQSHAAGFEVKTSSIISQPALEVLGEHNGSWYAIGLEKPGNLNKPPRYKIMKYAAGFSNGTSSELYPSFGEKTHYLQAAIINNKISLFYGRCELRVDESAMMNTQEGRAVMPVIERQDFDLNTLQPAGSAVVIFDQKDDYFAASGIEIVQNADKSKTAVLIKPYYKYQKYKVVFTDNQSGTETSHTYSFKDLKEYLSFVNAGINNNGQMYVVAKVRTDIPGTPQSKNGDKYHLFSLNKNSKEPAKADFTPSGESGKPVSPLKTAVLGNGELVIAFDRFSDAAGTAYEGLSVVKFNEALSVTGQRDIQPSEKLVPLAEQYNKFKKGREFSNVELQQVFPLEGSNFMLLTEYHARTPNTGKDAPVTVERSFMITYRMDEALNVRKQNFIHKKQKSAVVDYAFSAQAYRKGNDVYLFYNDDWESDDAANMNLKCSYLPENGESSIKKVLNTSGSFFTSMAQVFMGENNRILFREDRLVDFGDITKEVKLLEVTINE